MRVMAVQITRALRRALLPIELRVRKAIFIATCAVDNVIEAVLDALPADQETTVEELRARVDAQQPVWILDVREPREFEICRIPGSTLIPLGELPKRLAEIPQGPGAPDIVVHCKMGGRSAKAVRLLREHGIANARNLKGGILEWIDKVDRSLPRY